MRTVTLSTWFAGILLFGAGFGLGALIGPDPAREPAVSTGTLDDPATLPEPAVRPSGGSPRGLLGEVLQREAGAESGSVSRVAVEDASVAVHELLRTLARPEYPVGTGTLRGSCRTPQGDPVPSVLVHAFQVTDDEAFSYASAMALDGAAMGDPEADVLRNLRPSLEELRRRRMTRREAISDARGHFELTGLAHVPHVIGGRLARHHVAWTSGGLGSGALPGTFVTLVVSPRHRLEVDVRLPDGSQPAQAVLDVAPEESSWELWTFPWTPAAPYVELGDGVHQMTAFVGRRERAEARSETVTVQLLGGLAEARVALALAPARQVAGVVRFERLEDRPLRPVVVKAIELLEGERHEEAEERVWWADEAALEATEEGWRYRFGFLEGERHLIVLVDGDQILERAEFATGAQTTEEGPSFHVPAFDASRCIRVRVWNPEGRPYAGQLEFAWYLRHGERHAPQHPAGEGTYLLDRPTADEIGAEPALLVVRDALFGDVKVPCRPLEQEEVEVRLARPGRLRVVVADDGTKDLLEYLNLQLQAPGGVFREGTRGPDAARGLLFAPLQPGDYELVVEVRSITWNTHEIARRSVRVVEGEQVFHFVPPPLHTLEIAVHRDGEARGEVCLALEDGDGDLVFQQTRDVDDAGIAKFERLPAGTYQVRIGGFEIERPAQRVRVPGGGSVTFAPDTFLKERALRVSVHEEGGPLARAGLRTGDLLLGIGAVRFADREQMDAAFRGELYRSDEPIELLVLRDGVERRLSVDPKLLRDRNGLGGRLEPAVR